MKLEISVKFIDENGMEATKPVTVDTSVPDFDDFHDVNDFLLVFDQLEKAGLKLRNESFSTALAQYMETMSKKTARTAKRPKDCLIRNGVGSWTAPAAPFCIAWLPFGLPGSLPKGTAPDLVL